MGPLSTLANTTAIIAGKASGEPACACPGQLERERFDNDNAAEVGWENTWRETLFAEEPDGRRLAWISLIYWLLKASI